MNREMASSTEELKDFEPVSTTYHDSGCRKDWPLVSPVTSFILRYQNVGEPLEVARQFGLVFTINEVVRTAYKQAEANVPAYHGENSWELPMAGTFLVDQSGIVGLAFVDPDFPHRLDPSW